MSAEIDLSTLSESQLAIATTLDRPLFVEAGAGSGKTYTLTRRVAWALSEGSGADGMPYLDDLSQVLVITFTDAAAREIKERVRQTLRASGMGAAALSVDEAWISTIHAMCARILRRHALDLGLDPAFGIVRDSAQAELVGRALDDVMRAARREEGFAALIDEYELGRPADKGYTGVMGLVSQLLSAGAALPGGVSALSADPVDPSALEDALAQLELRVEELAAQKLAPAGRASADAAACAVRALGALAADERTPEALAEALSGVTLPRAQGGAKPFVVAARSALSLARAEIEFQRVAPLADAALTLARRAERRYAELKAEENCLDYDDLVRLALSAVRDHEAVRRDYEGRFRLVMVDEFQDTDDTQLELISLLAGSDARQLCTVGDAQQSIYRFRGADVSVFRRRGAQVGAEGTVRLDMNFRSHADVLALVERVCAPGPHGGGVLRGFMHLDDSPERKDTYRARPLPRIDIEVCAGPGASGHPRACQVEAMASQIADALARYREAGQRAGDMALLLGVTTHADLYIDAIRARGMECVVTGGSTFTKTDEAKVMRALLHVLANPADTASGLFPLLASEMFGLDANDFCELGSRMQDKLPAPTRRTIDRGLADMTLCDGHVPSARLSRAHDVIARALDDVRSRPVADVMADVVRDSGWLSRLEREGATGLARAANVLAAIRYVRDLTESLGLGPCRAAVEFDRWLSVAKVPPASLAGGGGSGDDGTVEVMTIHASKGLEYKVCAVAECWGNPSVSQSVSLSRAEGGRRSAMLRPPDRAFKLSDVLKQVDDEDLAPSSACGADVPLAERYLARQAAEREGEAEEAARKLYVALTRAREALVLGISAASSKKGVSSELAAATLEALTGSPDAPAPGVGSLDYGGSEPARLRCVVVDKDGEVEGFDDALPVAGAEAEGGAEAAPPLEFALFSPGWEGVASPEPSSWRAREGVFSYSSVHASSEEAAPAPTRAERAAAAEGAPAAEDADRATNLGSAFHELAQAMVESGGAVDESRVAAQARQWHLSARAEGRLRAALARWERSSLRAEALAWPVVRAEVPFFQRVDSPHGDYLEGAIDLLCTDGDGLRALVVDYKTGDAGLTPEEVRERHAMQAEFYAGVLLREGYQQVRCAFVCVERDDSEASGEPLVARYAFGA